MNKDVDASALVEEYLADRLMARTADYVRRGRNLHLLSLPDLEQHWIEIHLRWLKSRSADDYQATTDADGEFSLRGIKPPVEAVSEAFAALYDEISRHRDNPKIVSDISNFLEDREKPHH